MVLAACLEGSMTDFKLYFNNDALVPLSCYNKISESGQFIKNETFFFYSSRGWFCFQDDTLNLHHGGRDGVGEALTPLLR